VPLIASHNILTSQAGYFVDCLRDLVRPSGVFEQICKALEQFCKASEQFRTAFEL